MSVLVYHVVVTTSEPVQHDELGKAIQDGLVDTHPSVEAATVSFLKEGSAE